MGAFNVRRSAVVKRRSQFAVYRSPFTDGGFVLSAEGAERGSLSLFAISS
jgi:hypothetical protein